MLNKERLKEAFHQLSERLRYKETWELLEDDDEPARFRVYVYEVAGNPIYTASYQGLNFTGVTDYPYEKMDGSVVKEDALLWHVPLLEDGCWIHGSNRVICDRSDFDDIAREIGHVKSESLKGNKHPYLVFLHKRASYIPSSQPSS